MRCLFTVCRCWLLVSIACCLFIGCSLVVHCLVVHRSLFSCLLVVYWFIGSLVAKCSVVHWWLFSGYWLLVIGCSVLLVVGGCLVIAFLFGVSNSH